MLYFIIERKHLNKYSVFDIFFLYFAAAERLQVKHFFQDSALTSKPIVSKMIFFAQTLNQLSVDLQNLCISLPLLCINILSQKYPLRKPLPTWECSICMGMESEVVNQRLI